MVDGFERIAREGGATLSLDAKVEKLTNAGGGWRVDTSNGEALLPKYVLLALSPAECHELALAQRFLPELCVSKGLVEADSGGLSARPGPIVPDAPGLLVAGDWVGPEGMLADAALSSADRAARLVLAAAAPPG